MTKNRIAHESIEVSPDFARQVERTAKSMPWASASDYIQHVLSQPAQLGHNTEIAIPDSTEASSHDSADTIEISDLENQPPSHHSYQ